MSLAWIPRGILSRIQNLCCRFLWRGNQPGRIYAWAKWDALTLPKKWGGWGLKKLDYFSSTLAAKLGWQLVTTDNLWTRVAYSKYIAPTQVLDWIRRPVRLYTGISIIWKDVLKALDPIRSSITWQIYSGNRVCIGIDPWIGCGNMHRLPPDMLLHLGEQNFTPVAHIADELNSTFLQQAWKTDLQLNIPPLW